ncbi:MAG TPA: hypothetical protein VK735_39500 [Pseudonocardia sp.]|uniref:hypothetical protein n=1 Tax=Pseudonocardia sp. TaxID=60912 RepID=UPI002C1FB209|nr:hypothetical protein [Pseudonocardia sp.]HTF53568.1 hypothetical protein [Pseudonocardia sp.]
MKITESHTHPEPTTVTLPGLPLEIHEGYSPMNLTQVLASGESDKYELTWVRIIPLGIKLWIKDKETGKTVRTAVFNEQNLLKAIADAALAQPVPAFPAPEENS